MLQEFGEKRDNLFDRIDIILSAREKIKGRLNNPGHEEEAMVYRQALRKSINTTIKEKRLGGLRRQAKYTPYLIIASVVVLVIGLFRHNPISIIGGIMAIICFGWTYFSAISRLWALVPDADRAAAAAVRQKRPSQASQPTTDLRQGTPRVSQADFMQQALHQARQSAQQTPKSQ